MNRRSFIESNGATCSNWTWSWSFVNIDAQTVIFGAWDIKTIGTRSLILSESWAITLAGRKAAAYTQSREHIRLIEEKGYRLLTFPIIYSDQLQDMHGVGPAKIKGFEPKLTPKSLVSISGNWYASDDKVPNAIAEEVPNHGRFLEGSAETISVNAYERNSDARAACIQHYGAVCAACKFDFELVYGAVARGFIHVHHLVPLATVKKEYELDPIRDLVPLCPNCHAVVHLTNPAMSVDALKASIEAASFS